MRQIIYVSSAVELFSHQQLEQLLAKAREANAARGLTGALLYSDGNFLQVLEGPEDAVRATFAKISQDPRHCGVLKLLERPIQERSFPDWAMASAQMPAGQLANFPGWRAWDAMPASAKAGHARTLIQSFHRQNA